MSDGFKSLCKAGNDQSIAWFNLGMACQSFSQSEAELRNDHLAASFGHLATTMETISQMYKHKSESELLEFREPVHEYTSAGRAIESTLKDRKSAQLSWETEIARLDVRKKKLDELQAKGPEASTVKIGELQHSVTSSVNSTDSCKADLDEITRRVFDEIDRFNLRKAEDMKAILSEFVKRQIDFAKAQQAEWTKLNEVIR